MIFWVDGGFAGGRAYGSWLASCDCAGGNCRASFMLPNCRTNNEAEYGALIRLLQDTRANIEMSADDEIRTDSQLVVGHLTKGWRIKDSLKPFVVKAFQLLAKAGNPRIVQVPREEIVAKLGH